MVVKADCRNALALALEQGVGEPTMGRAWHFYNARPIRDMDPVWKQVLLCEQGNRPDFLALEASGYNALPELEKDGVRSEGALLLVGRSRKRNEQLLAEAWNRLDAGGRVIVSGNKLDGTGSLRKWFAGKIGPVQSLSKFHAVVFWADKQAPSEISVPDDETLFDGYSTRAGMFSADGPDRGSEILAQHFDNRIWGKVADLGAGWGYLSGELLKASDKVSELDLFEADYRSIRSAENALPSKSSAALSFHWCDVRSEFPKKPYDWVIMNPPFHSSRAAEPELGQKFIDVAASTLPAGGRLLMVANRNLPYEKVLQRSFRRTQAIAEQDGFKVIEAVK